MSVSRQPFTFVWKAIDFGGSGSATSETDFMEAMYTPHYSPMKSLPKSMNTSSYAYAHDMIALAHVLRNMVSFMTSTTQHPTPYSRIDNTERFFQTPNSKRLLLTNRVITEL